MLKFPIEFDQINSLALRPFENEHQLLKVLNSMSENFTIKRNQIAQNYSDEEKISAYLCYFFSTNISKVGACLNRLCPELVQEIAQSNIIDFGTGPGTTIFGLLEYFKEFSGSMVGIDSSQLMLEQARKIQVSFYTDFNLSFQTNINSFPEENRTLIFSNSLNEVGDVFATNIIRKINPERVIFLEPGTKESFSHIREVQKNLYTLNYHVQYPCSQTLECTLSEQDWCHQYLQLKFSSSIERLTQKMKKDRRSSPVIFHLYSKSKREKSSLVIFRYLGENKFSFEFEICNQENIIEKHQVLKSYLKSKGIKKSKMKSYFIAGEIVKIKVIKKLAVGFYQSEVEITQ